MSNSVRPHRQQPTRLPHPWDSPGKNTGVGCHFLLQCMKVERESEVAQSCPTLSDPMDCSLTGSSVHGLFQARVLEWGAIAFSDKWKGTFKNCIKSRKFLKIPYTFTTDYQSNSDSHIYVIQTFPNKDLRAQRGWGVFNQQFEIKDLPFGCLF